jgi:hypothetical protein
MKRLFIVLILLLIGSCVGKESIKDEQIYFTIDFIIDESCPSTYYIDNHLIENLNEIYYDCNIEFKMGVMQSHGRISRYIIFMKT